MTDRKWTRYYIVRIVPDRSNPKDPHALKAECYLAQDVERKDAGIIIQASGDYVFMLVPEYESVKRALKRLKKVRAAAIEGHIALLETEKDRLEKLEFEFKPHHDKRVEAGKKGAKTWKKRVAAEYKEFEKNGRLHK